MAEVLSCFGDIGTLGFGGLGISDDEKRRLIRSFWVHSAADRHRIPPFRAHSGAGRLPIRPLRARTAAKASKRLSRAPVGRAITTKRVFKLLRQPEISRRTLCIDMYMSY